MRTSASNSSGEDPTLRPIANATAADATMTAVMARCRPKRKAASLPSTLAGSDSSVTMTLTVIGPTNALSPLRHDKGPEGDDPGAHAVKLEAMRAVTEDVAERSAIAQNRPEIEKVSVCRRRFASREPEAHANHDKRTGARDIKRRAPASTVRNEL